MFVHGNLNACMCIVQRSKLSLNRSAGVKLCVSYLL